MCTLLICDGVVSLDEKDLNVVETYNFKKREWRQLSSLGVKRNSAGICQWKVLSEQFVYSLSALPPLFLDRPRTIM